jgi:hypothetical protein
MFFNPTDLLFNKWDRLAHLNMSFLAIPNMPLFAIFWRTYACEPNKKAEHATHTQPACTTLPSWPPPPLLPTGNAGHAPTPTRGARAALCALLPAQSARQSLPRLQQMFTNDLFFLTAKFDKPLHYKTTNLYNLFVKKGDSFVHPGA